MKTRLHGFFYTVGRLVLRLWHRVEHLLGCNAGTCHSFWRGDRLFVSFKCEKCGKLSGVHDITEHLTPNASLSPRANKKGIHENDYSS